MSSPLFILNDEGRIVDLNPAASQILQKPSELLLGRAIYEAASDWKEFCKFYADSPDQPTWIMKLDNGIIRTYSGRDRYSLLLVRQAGRKNHSARGCIRTILV